MGNLTISNPQGDAGLVRTLPPEISFDFDTLKKSIMTGLTSEYTALLTVKLIDKIFNAAIRAGEKELQTIQEYTLEQRAQLYHTKIAELYTDTLRGIIQHYDVYSLHKSGKSNEELGIFDKTTHMADLLLTNGETNTVPDGTFPWEKPVHDMVEIHYQSIPDFRSMCLNPNTGIEDSLLGDVSLLVKELYILFKLNDSLADDENSFMNFFTDVVYHLHGNVEFKFPKELINFTIFQLCLPGYPFETKSKKVYGVSNTAVSNKLLYTELYCKNVNAFRFFLEDAVEIDITSADTSKTERDTLISVYGICIALMGIYGENIDFSNQFSKLFLGLDSVPKETFPTKLFRI